MQMVGTLNTNRRRSIYTLRQNPGNRATITISKDWLRPKAGGHPTSATLWFTSASLVM